MKRVLSVVVVALVIEALFGCQSSPLDVGGGPRYNLEDSIVLTAHTMPGDVGGGTNDAVDFADMLRVSSGQGQAIFDVAVDIDSANHVVVIPNGVLLRSKPATREASVARLNGQFINAEVAPNTGYDPYHSIVLDTGNTVVVQMLRREDACPRGDYLYGKIGLDSVNFVTRTIHVHILVNPNCGVTDLRTPDQQRNLQN